MKNLKRTIPLYFLLIVLLVATSCSTIKNELGLSQKAGIKYNDLQISEKELDEDLDALADNKPLAKSLQEGDKLVVDGKVTAKYRASWANIKMRTLAIKEIRLKHKMNITKKDKEKAREDAKDLFTSDKTVREEIWKAFPRSFQDRLVEGIAEQYAMMRAAPKVTDKEMKEYFIKNQDTIAAPCDSGKSIYHILVDSEKEAKDIENQLNGGADFGTLAKEKSKDTSSGASGGSLGCFEPGNFVEEFEKEASGLAPGKTSGIVKTQFGYHILRAEEYKKPEFKDVKGQIRSILEPEKQQKLFEEVKSGLSKAKIKVSPKYGRVSFEIDESTGKKSEIPTIVPLKEDKESTTTVGVTTTKK